MQLYALDFLGFLSGTRLWIYIDQLAFLQPSDPGRLAQLITWINTDKIKDITDSRQYTGYDPGGGVILLQLPPTMSTE